MSTLLTTIVNIVLEQEMENKLENYIKFRHVLIKLTVIRYKINHLP